MPSLQNISMSFSLISKLFFVLLIFLSMNSVSAETFKIKVKGAELKNLTAVEFKLALEPANSFVIDENIKVFDLIKAENGNLAQIPAQKRILFKVVDPVHNSIRIFFNQPNKINTLEIDGNLVRSNYSGEPNIKITEVNYISDFSLSIKTDKLKSQIEVSSQDETLPYKGISKAEILGPKERIFSQTMFISIGDIETYGFNINEKINHFRINGEEARLIDGSIIAARLKLDLEEIPERLPITLEIEVDNQTIRKEVGSIEFFDSFN